MRKLLLILSLVIYFVSYNVDGKDIYWVKGSGAWHDYYNHWAYESGVDTIEQGRVPTTEDDVYFDENSFANGEDTLEITISTDAVCRTLDFTRCQNLNKLIIINHTSSVPIRIYGSLLLIDSLRLKNINEIQFLGENGSFKLLTKNKQLPLLRFKDRNSFWQIEGELHCKSSLLFYGEGSRYELGGAAFISGSLSHQYGSFITNNYPIDCQFFYVGHNADSLFLGSSQITLSHKNFVVYNDDTYIDGGTSVIHMKNSASVFINKGQRFYNVIFEDTTENTQELKGPGSYNHVKFNSNGIIEDNNSFDSLSFAAGHTVTIAAGKIQTINKALNAEGRCDAYIYI